MKSKILSFWALLQCVLLMLCGIMAFRAQAIMAAVASGDTVKTTLGSITVPTNVKRITGVWCYATGGAGLTTLENVSGIFELESPSLNLSPLALPLEIVVIVGTGVASHQARIWPLSIPNVAASTITCYVTMDQALAINPDCRWGLIYDV